MTTPARPSFHRVLLASALGALLLAAGAFGGVAYAAHQFSDVPNDHPFHDEIDWLAETEITTGFGDGTFRPSQPVTRQAMAAFMQRFNATYVQRESSTNPGPGATGWSHSATCEAGERPLSGGGDINLPDVYLTRSEPVGNSWQVSFESEGNAVLDPTLLTVNVLCGPEL